MKKPEYPNTVKAYVDQNGACPYEDWLQKFTDKKAIAAILSRVDRIQLGLFGDSESVGDGVHELRIHLGPGYRIYYAQDGKHVYLLLCGGSKRSQKKDIKKAKE